MRQALFEMQAADGTLLTFAVLEDGRSALLRDGEVDATYETDEKSLGRAIQAYFRLVDVCGGARHSFESLGAVNGHPHAG